jgi:DNA-3-methyladenine glycosylase II
MNREVLARGRRHLRRRDPVLAEVIRRVGPCRWGEAQPDLFAGLVHAIVSQQLSVKAAATILGRVQRLLPDERIEPGALLSVPLTALRAAGLSTRKAEYVRDLAARFTDGSLRVHDLDELPDAAVVEQLTSVRGIGPWTAEMILIFRLNRPDVLPLSDAALLRAVQRTYKLRRRPTPRQLTRLSEPWRPWRSLACWYLWASIDAPADES